MQLPRALCTSLFALLMTAAVQAQTPGGVSLKDDGKDTVTLSNGIVSATFSKSGASVKSYQYKGFEMLNAGYYSMDGGDNYRTPKGCAFSVKTQSPEIVDIAMKRTWSNEPQAFDIEIHYVLRRGESGIYTYAMLDHPASYPNGGYGEWRFVWKLSDDTLEKIFVDDVRQWIMASSKDKRETTGIKEITKLTTGVRAGQYDCKYDYSVSYYEKGTWGHASNRNKIGAFIVLGSQEYFNDGPTKQDLNAAAGINHIHFGMNHYGGSNPRIPKGTAWQKFYGPFLLYCNSGANADACWADAQAKVKTEQAAWPFSWLTNNPAYPLEKERGSASGTFRVMDAFHPKLTGANAWIGLAQPGKPGTGMGEGWQFDSEHYQYWTRVKADGSFTIPDVRPGTYTLFAFTDGAVGEFSRTGVRVEAGKTVNLSTVTWAVPHKGSRLAWEIGTPDRTAKEFFHGNDYFHGYVWQNFSKEFSNPLNFTIGKSKEAKDWNFAQTRYDDSSKGMVWNINFTLESVPANGNATLTLAIASAQRGRVDVRVNGGSSPTAPPIATVTPAVQGGNALLRESIHAKYCVEYVAIPVEKLKKGENTISLQFPDTRAADAHIMYDYLSLELP